MGPLAASLTYELTLAGLAVGSAAALTGIGLIVTYRATGVLNLAHGAVAMITAYALRQFAVEWDWPLWAAAALCLVVIAPGIGLLLGRFVFRPLSVLQDRGESGGAQTLVASIGVFVLLVGAAGLLWGTGARSDAPELLPDDPWVQLATVVVLALAVAAITRWTRIGRELRAVVDNRRLASLSGIDADRVADTGWAFGTFTAGLTGVLLAPQLWLDPYGLPLLVMAVIGVAVAAAMRNLPVAVLAALAIGVLQSQLTRFHPGGWEGTLVQAVSTNLFAVGLLVAALALPRIGVLGGGGDGAGFLKVPAATPDRDGRAWVVAGVLFLLPLGFAGTDLTTAVQVPALGVVLLSLVVVTGRGGQVSLGQAAYAGLGALLAALLAAGRVPGVGAVPELVALGLAVVVVAPLGLLVGYPAIRRQGLALALTTLAVGVAVSRFVFAQPDLITGLTLDRPAGFADDRSYYVLELLLLGGAVLAVWALRRGRTGRALAAVRDHEAGAAASGVGVPALKSGAFVAGAGLAALGGGMLGMGVQAFDPNAYDPVRALLWFAAVVVLGADSVLGALAAAALLVGLDAGTQGGMAAAVVGVLAVLLGRFPGGLYEAAGRGWGRLRGLAEPVRLTPRGEHLRARLRLAAASSPAHPPVAVADRGVGVTAADSGASAADSGASAAAAGPPPPGSGTGAPPLSPSAASPPTRTGTRRTTAALPSPSDAKPPAKPPRENRGPVALPPADGHAPQTPHTPAAADSPAPPPPIPAPDDPARPPHPRAAADNHAPQTPPTPAGDNHAPQTPPTPAAGGRAAVGRHGRAQRAGPALPHSHRGRATRRWAQRVLAGASRVGVRRKRPGPPFPPSGTPAPGGGGAGGASASARLTARAVSVAYGDYQALDSVDIAIPPGRITALVGPNGAGKSTLFHCLAGTLRPSSGQVILDGHDITRAPAHARTRKGIARTFQQLAVFPSLTVEENVRIGAEHGASSGRHPTQAVDRALDLLDLTPLRHARAAGLQTGTLRRVELARALAGGPRVLLLDEPAAGLDTAEAGALARTLRALAADGMALLIVEHDLDLVVELADTAYAMSAGRITAAGPAPRVLADLQATAS